MKKQLLTAASMLAGIAAIAQPTIQANQFNWTDNAAFVYRYAAGQSPVAPGAAGANVNWDFSSLSAGSALNYTTASCPGDADCGTFPGANQVIGVGASSKVFYAKSATAMEQHGELSSGSITFTDPMKVMQFPMTYNQTFNDTYASSGGGGSKSGTITSTVDGYGTLKTPTGTYTNVLRQKVVDQATVVNAGGTMNMTITQYYWFVGGIHHHVMALLITEITGMPVQVPTTYVTTYTTKTSGGGNVGINETSLLAGRVSVFPNPASDHITIKADGLDIQSVGLYNVLGQSVLHKTIADQGITSMVELAAQELSSGCYFLKLNTSEGQVSKQVMIR